MKRWPWVLVMIALLLLLSGCGGGPEKAAEDWFVAMAGGDGVTALKLTCPAYREQVQMQGLFLGGINMLIGGMAQGAEIDSSDLKFETVSSSGDTANVRVRGEIITGLMGMAVAEQVDVTLLMERTDGEWLVCGGS